MHGRRGLKPWRWQGQKERRKYEEFIKEQEVRYTVIIDIFLASMASESEKKFTYRSQQPNTNGFILYKTTQKK